MVRVGIVCEGSHDYLFLKEVTEQILSDRGADKIIICALQPTIDATSRQLDGGGWAAVIEWCKQHGGDAWTKFFRPTLFQTSDIYDAIIVHLDGDVLEVSNLFTISQISVIGNIQGRIKAIQALIQSTLSPAHEFSSNLITAIPVRQTEAWLLATLRPAAGDHEAKDYKRATKRILKRRFSGSAADQVAACGKTARTQLTALRSTCYSFEQFALECEARF